MFKRFKQIRAYQEFLKAYKPAMDAAILLVDAATRSQLLVFADKNDAFINYSKVMNDAEMAICECKHMINLVVRDTRNDLYIRENALGIAKVYFTASKIFATTGAALALIGGFQPIRAKEALELNINYPVLSDK